MTQNSIGLGLWGDNGHQIHWGLEKYPAFNPLAVGAMAEEGVTELRKSNPNLHVYEEYQEFLQAPGLAFVSLCSPLRDEQARHAIAALEAGIHVYAEKPCATNEADLDRIIAAAERGSATFHEMAGTAFWRPYWHMRELLVAGVIGEVIQVSAQKSYPYVERRPTNEAVDGGLVAQNGVHAMRFVEHVTGLRATTIEAIDTQKGEPRRNSDLQMASAMMGRLENGGLFSVVANYLNQPGFGTWGNEMLRIFGTKGMLESVDGGTRTRLVVGEDDRGEIDTSTEPPDWLEYVIANAFDAQPMPFDLDTELHPTRMVLRAKADAEQRRKA